MKEIGLLVGLLLVAVVAYGLAASSRRVERSHDELEQMRRDLREKSKQVQPRDVPPPNRKRRGRT